tara:strand:+ start:44 stop:466 length:423 start_codon:yes stop_codon:yes gene_type:complete
MSKNTDEQLVKSKLFLKRLGNSGTYSYEFINKLINLVNLREDITLHYIKYKNNRVEMRVRKNFNNHLGFKNYLTIYWQVREKRFSMQSLLTDSELVSVGLKLDNVTEYTLKNQSFLDERILKKNTEQILELINKYIQNEI